MSVHNCEKGECDTRLDPESVAHIREELDKPLHEVACLVCSDHCKEQLEPHIPDRFDVMVADPDTREPLNRTIDRIETQIQDAQDTIDETDDPKERRSAYIHKQGMTSALNIIKNEFSVPEEDNNQ